MKHGRTLTELAAEIERQANAKADYIAPTSTLAVQSNGHTDLVVMGQGRYEVNDTAHQQIGEHLDIPRKYYDRLRTEHPALLDTSVNTLLSARPATERRMVRTLDGRARAFLSDRYRRLDHYDLLEAVLPELMETEGLSLASCDVTDAKLYVKAQSTRLEAEVKKGDVVQMGLVVTNSEIGWGGIKVEPYSVRLVCLNGMTHTDWGMRKNHVGRVALGGDGEGAYQYFADETLQADDRAFFLKVRDVVRGTLSEKMLGQVVGQMREAAGIMLEGSVEKTVEVLGQRHGLNQAEQSSVLRNLIQGSDLSVWGLSNAITATAGQAETYDRSSDLEALGGAILALPKSDMQALVAAR